MSERRDDTPEPAAPPRPPRPAVGPPPETGSYYYDDATGYEVYRPAEDEGEPCDESNHGEVKSNAP